MERRSADRIPALAAKRGGKNGAPGLISWQLIQVARTASALRGRSRGRHPWRGIEIEKLGHAFLRASRLVRAVTPKRTSISFRIAVRSMTVCET